MKPDLLGHLSSEQVESLMARYYAGEAFDALMRDFGLDCHKSRLSQAFPPLVLSDHPCPYCGQAMQRTRVGRTSYVSRITCPVHCTTCGHREDGCYCAGCKSLREERDAEEAAGLERLMASLNSSRTQQRNTADFADLDGLSLSHALYLITMASACGKPGSTALTSLRHTPSLWAPTPLMQQRVACELYGLGLIAISSASPHNSVFSTAEGQCADFDVLAVNWELTFAPTAVDTACRLADLKQRLAIRKHWPEHWFLEVPALWRELAVHECLAFLYQAMDRHNFPLKLNEECFEVSIIAGLDFLAIGQVCNHINGAVQLAASRIISRTLSRNRAENFVLSAFSGRLNRDRDEGWDVFCFKRNVACPPSGMATRFCAWLPGMAGRYFKRPPLPENVPGC